MSEDSRSYQRHLTRHELTDNVDVYDSVRDLYIGRLVNVHAEGLMLMGDAALAADKLYQLDLRLPQPVNGRNSVHVGIDCLWTRGSEDTAKYWSGCQIIDISPEGVEDIEALVELLEP